MAGKQKYTQDEVISALKKSRGMVSPAARALGCEPDTIRNYARRYPRVQQTMDDQRDQFLDESEIQLIAAVNRREPWAIAFTLKTVGRKRGYVERQEHEIAGKDGGAIETVVKHEFDYDAYRALFSEPEGGDGLPTPAGDGAL